MGTARDRVMLTASVGLSAAGDTLAIAPLATILAAETGSGFAVAAFFGALWGPSVVLGSVAGRIVDRFENVRLLTVVSLAQAVVAASMIVALDSIPALLVLATMIGTGNAVAQAAEFSLSPLAAGENGVARLNGWIESSRYVGMTIGPALGGLLAAVGHPQVALAGNALTFLAVVAIALSLTVRRHPAAGEHGSGSGEGAGEARSGFAVLRRTSSLWTTILIAIASLATMTIVWPAMPFYATDVLGGSAATYGLLMATWTAGMAIGSIGLASRVKTEHLAVAAVAAIAIQGFWLGLPTLLLSIPFAALAYVLGGAAHGAKNVFVRTLIHQRVPAAAHGRAAAAYNALRNGAEMIALVGGGILVTALGARYTIALAGGVPILIAIAGLFVLARRSGRSRGPIGAPRPAEAG
jgi:predicted MFS family arabinose efflux permease